MKTWYFYDLQTGLFTGRTFSANSDQQLAVNTPEGCGWKDGDFDPLSQKVDVKTGEVVDYQPPQPDSDHEWDDATDPQRPRWRKRRDVVEREQRRAVALEQIEVLEKKQARRVREILADQDEKLKAIDQEIAALRSHL